MKKNRPKRKRHPRLSPTEVMTVSEGMEIFCLSQAKITGPTLNWIKGPEGGASALAPEG
jgi:hypothetical protein